MPMTYKGENWDNQVTPAQESEEKSSVQFIVSLWRED
jgi:hypothetical protein